METLAIIYERLKTSKSDIDSRFKYPENVQKQVTYDLKQSIQDIEEIQEKLRDYRRNKKDLEKRMLVADGKKKKNLKNTITKLETDIDDYVESNKKKYINFFRDVYGILGDMEYHKQFSSEKLEATLNDIFEKYEGDDQFDDLYERWSDKNQDIIKQAEITKKKNQTRIKKNQSSKERLAKKKEQLAQYKAQMEKELEDASKKEKLDAIMNDPELQQILSGTEASKSTVAKKSLLQKIFGF